MSQTIQLKRSSGSINPTSLQPGEPAWIEGTKTLMLGLIGGGMTAIGGDGANYLKANQNITLSGDASGSGTTAIAVTLANIVTAGTAAKITYNAKGQVTAGAALVAADVPKTLDSSYITNFDTQVRTSRLDQMAVPTAALVMGNQELQNLGAPQSANSAARLSDVQAMLNGQLIKASVQCATTANINLSAPGTAIDGYTLVNGDRFLVKNQTTASQNGVYIFNGSAAAATRATDFNTAGVTNGVVTGNIRDGSAFFVENGTVNAATNWTLITPDNPAITVGTTNLTFTQSNGAGSYTAVPPLLLTGNAFSFLRSNNTLLLNGSNQLAVGGGTSGLPLVSAGASTEAAFGPISLTAAVSGVLPIANGGTGLTALPANGSILKVSSGAITAAVAGTDYLTSSSVIDGGTF